MRSVVLQPTYLPWMGYFGMVDAADIFVFYNDVQFSPQSWQQRNRIKTSQGWIWLSVPVVRQFGSKINGTRINNSTDWNKKHWESIKQSYTKAPFFEQWAPIFKEVYDNEWEYLADLNVTLIQKIAKALGLETKFAVSSDLEIGGVKTERLVNTLQKIGADEYVSGPGAKDYIDVDSLREKGIKLYWYEYQHPVYPQIRGEFVPYLSVIDLLFNTGAEAVRYIREGAKGVIRLEGEV
ncbi:MAG: WbqC family protein [Dehalococcoidales bacterium]|nr:WbqC family protein [Dehalococcoidales bacterium]